MSYITMTDRIISLKRIKKTEIGLFKSILKYVSELDKELDGVTGPLMEELLLTINQTSESIYDTFVMMGDDGKEIKGLCSVSPDDQRVGKRYGYDGIWLSGIFVNRKYRGLDLSHTLNDAVEQHIEEIVDKLQEPIQAFLFTEVDISAKIAIDRGFRKIDIVQILSGKSADLYTKEYQPPSINCT